MSRFLGYKLLSKREQALVAIAVLLDGHDSALYLSYDRDRGQALSKVALELADIAPELRMPLVGTLLRDILVEVESG